jgi:hypothetical protein
LAAVGHEAEHVGQEQATREEVHRSLRSMLVVAAHHSMRQLQMLEPAEEQVAMEMLAERDQLTESIVTMALAQ